MYYFGGLRNFVSALTRPRSSPGTLENWRIRDLEMHPFPEVLGTKNYIGIDD
jgi:hypothetical protein